ncbi:MAG: hypothetical protein ACJ746_15850 [Bryobacteraceae bacterium]
MRRLLVEPGSGLSSAHTSAQKNLTGIATGRNLFVDSGNGCQIDSHPALRGLTTLNLTRVISRA